MGSSLLKCQCWSRATWLGAEFEVSASKRSPRLEAAKGRTWRPVGSSWKPPAADAYLLTPTWKEPFLLREAPTLESWGCTCNGGGSVEWCPFWGCNCSPFVPVSRCRLEFGIHSLGMIQVICAHWENLWRSRILSSDKGSWIWEFSGSEPLVEFGWEFPHCENGSLGEEAFSIIPQGEEGRRSSQSLFLWLLWCPHPPSPGTDLAWRF